MADNDGALTDLLKSRTKREGSNLSRFRAEHRPWGWSVHDSLAKHNFKLV